MGYLLYPKIKIVRIDYIICVTNQDGLAVSEQGTNAELHFISRVAYNKQEAHEGL